MLVTPQQMAVAENRCDKTSVSLRQLMDNAALSLADFITAHSNCNRILFLCGNGNNGGDGIVAANILKEKGIDASIALLCGNPKTKLAQNAFVRAQHNGVVVISDSAPLKAMISECDVLVDCVFGTGFRGALPAEIADIFAYDTNALRISADIPSGANGLTGEADKGTFAADYTLTFGRVKTGLVMYPAREMCGEIIVCDIGIPDECYPCDECFFEIDEEYARRILPKRAKNSHKGDYGKLLCIVGSENMVGAAALCLNSALRSGAGIVKAAVPKSVRNALSSSVYEALWQPLEVDKNGFITADNFDALKKSAQCCDAVVIGCGLGVTDDTRYIVRNLIAELDCPIILDADGINCIAGCIDILTGKDNIVLTPHPGEAARLLDTSIAQVASDRIDCARKLAFSGCSAVLKSASVIVAQNSKFGINTGGNSGMSKGGSGDVLAGIIGALAAQGMQLYEAAVLGVYIHSEAGRLASAELSEYSCLPSDIITRLSSVFAQLQK